MSINEPNKKDIKMEYTLKSNFSNITYTMVNYSKNIDGKLCLFAHDGTVPIKIVSMSDRSAIELFTYDSKCSCCWLGIAHSKEYHLKTNN